MTVYFLGILSISLSFSFSCLHWSQLSEFHLGNVLFHLFTLKKKTGFHILTSLSWLRAWVLKTDCLGQIYYHTGCVILGKFNFPLCQSLHLQNGDNNNTSEGCSDAKWKYTCKVGNKGGLPYSGTFSTWKAFGQQMSQSLFHFNLTINYWVPYYVLRAGAVI